MPTRTWIGFALGSLVAGLSVLALSDLWFLLDDGAIAMRYAARIAEEGEFAYNAGERVHGASPVLSVALTALLLRLQLDPFEATRAIALAGAMLTCGLLAAATWRRRAFLSGALAVGGFLLIQLLPPLLHSGLEPPLLFALVAALCCLEPGRRPVLDGLVLGLLVVAKLDLTLGLVAYVLLHVFRTRKLPLRALGVALAVVAPFALWLLWSFGTVLPNSGLVKVFEHTDHTGFDPLWMVHLLQREFGPLVLLAVGFAVHAWFTGARDARRLLSLWTCGHLAFYSLVDMGDAFVWYASLPAIASLGIIALGLADLEGRAAVRVPQLHRALPAAAGGILVLATSVSWNGNSVRASSGSPPPMSAQRTLALRASGAWLRLNTTGSERAAVSHGFPALEYGGPVLDLTGLNSRDEDLDGAGLAYSIVHVPEQVAFTRRLDQLYGGYRVAAEFSFGHGRSLVLARDHSELARTGRRSFRYRADQLEGAASGAVRLEGADLVFAGPGAFGWGTGLGGPLRLTFELDRPQPGLEVRIEHAGRLLHLASAAPPGPLTVEVPAGPGELRIVATGERGSARVDSIVLEAGRGIRGTDLFAATPRERRAIDRAHEIGARGDRVHP